MFRFAVLALAVVCCAVPAAAGDDTPAPAAKPAGDGAVTVRITLTNGRTLDGTLRVEGGWERLDPKTGWTACAKGDAGASLRLWRGTGENANCMTLSAGDVKSFEKVAADEAGGGTGVGDAEAEKRRSEEAARAREARDARLAAAAAAAKKKKDDEAARKKAAEDEARAKADAALLAKFPPAQWSAERVKQIEQRTLIQHVMPTDEEREFMRVYPEWARAVAAAEAKAAAEKKAAEEKKAEEARKAEEAAEAKKKAEGAEPPEEKTPEPAKEQPKPADEKTPEPAKDGAK